MALLILIAAIMIGMSYLYLSADMMTPQFASTPETDRVIRKDSLRQKVKHRGTYFLYGLDCRCDHHDNRYQHENSQCTHKDDP